MRRRTWPRTATAQALDGYKRLREGFFGPNAVLRAFGHTFFLGVYRLSGVRRQSPHPHRIVSSRREGEDPADMPETGSRLRCKADSLPAFSAC